MKQLFVLVICLAVCKPALSQVALMNENEARQILKSMRLNGNVGGSLDMRVTGTDRSYNYKLRATWLTPQVLQAAGRLLEISKGLPQAEVRRILQEAEPEAAHYVLVELDPREGSGVIPKDWLARFGPKGIEDRKVTGQVIPDQGVWRTLISAFPRDYSYDIFIVKFPTEAQEGIKVLDPSDSEAELLVRIYNKTGKVKWRIISQPLR